MDAISDVESDVESNKDFRSDVRSDTMAKKGELREKGVSNLRDSTVGMFCENI